MHTHTHAHTQAHAHTRTYTRPSSYRHSTDDDAGVVAETVDLQPCALHRLVCLQTSRSLHADVTRPVSDHESAAVGMDTIKARCMKRRACRADLHVRAKPQTHGARTVHHSRTVGDEPRPADDERRRRQILISHYRRWSCSGHGFWSTTHRKHRA